MKRIILFILVLNLVYSCKYIRNTEMLRVSDEYPVAEHENPEFQYKIAPFDYISVLLTTNNGYNYIFDNTARNGSTGGGNQRNMNYQGMTYQVEFDGLVKLPVLGRVKVAGMTPREAEDFLEKEYAEYYREPFINVTISNRFVYVFKNRGSQVSTVTISRDNYTLIDAIVDAGGMTEDSKSYSIRLIRGNVVENPDVFNFSVYNLEDLQNTNILLESGDIIYIDSKPRYISKFLRELDPYFSVITTILIILGYSNIFKN